MIQKKISKEDLDRFWTDFRENKTDEARESLIMAYVHIVKYVVGRVAIGLPSYVDVNDLFSAGLLGLMQALDKFEPERKIKFETYAIPRIRGAMLDELRSQDWFPRSIRKKAKTLEQAYATVESKLGRSATDKEIAKHLKISLADYYDLIDEVCLTTLISLDMEIANCNEGLYSIINNSIHFSGGYDPLQILEDKELHQLVKGTLDKLPEKEGQVLTLYYYEELTLKEIGEILNISESRVCQIHTKATMRLRGRIAQYTQTLSVNHLISRLKAAKAKKHIKSRIA